jgi:hypothetical protein
MSVNWCLFVVESAKNPGVFWLTNWVNPLCCVFRDKRVPQARDVLPDCRHGDQAREADLGQINDEGRVLPCTGENCRSLTVWSRISLVKSVDGDSQQTLNCALSVDLF